MASPLLRFLTAAALALPALAQADSSLKYRLAGSETMQPVWVKEGRVLISGLDAKQRRDFLFDRTRHEAVVIDHKTQTFLRVNDQALERLDRQSEPLKPLLAGLGAQLGKLTPEQRAKWQGMLGGVDLETIASASRNSGPTRVARDDRHRKVGSYSCDPFTVLQGRKKVAELCVSQAEALGISSDDYATIRSLFDFARHVAVKTQGFGSLMGISIPVVSVGDIPGIPVQIRGLSGKHQETLTLADIRPTGSDAVPMDIPAGYRSEPLKLW